MKGIELPHRFVTKSHWQLNDCLFPNCPNNKSELEIRMIHDKIDHMIMHQQQELIEIQKVQIEMMNDILNQIKK